MEPHEQRVIMEYGQIAGNSSINATIYHCFEYLREEDERKFVKKFREQPHDSVQIAHTFRELVLGAHLSSKGVTVRYDHRIGAQTPDWSILDVRREAITGIVELTSFHIDKATEYEIEGQMQAKGLAGYWRDQNKDNVERLYHVIWRKVTKYRSMVNELQLPYVVAVFGEFEAALDFEEVCRCLLDARTGLFGVYPELSGLLYFEEASGQYSFSYAGNPNALRTIDLPVGVFPSEVI
jgi:hypothetical protein